MSISTRIIVRLTVTILIAAGMAYGWLYIKQSRVNAYLRDHTLLRQARELSRYVVVGDDGKAQLILPPELSEAYNGPASLYRYVVRDDGGRIVAASSHRAGALSTDLPHRKLNERDVSFAETGAGAQTPGGRKEFTIRVEETVPRTASINVAVFQEFMVDGGWLGIPFLIVLVAVCAHTVRKSLSPLDELSTQAAKINPGNSSSIRLRNDGIPCEFSPVVGAINNALDRLDDGLRRQREFGANAAHQLRTPLAVLSANIDLMTDRDTAARLRYDVDQMSRIVNQLLLIARLEPLNIPLDQTVELRSCVQEAAENLAPVAVATGKVLELDGPDKPAFVRGNRNIVIAAVRNLIENALKHTPRGGMIRIRLTAQPSIEVHDSGPGVPPDIRDKIFERFWRADATQSGAGLGLSIVRQIMEALNGSVSVGDGAGGGAIFVLSFPPSLNVTQPALT